MSDALTAIEKLKSLLEVKEGEAAEKPINNGFSEITVERATVEEKAEQVSLNRDPEKRPKSIEGLSLSQILILQADGGLDQAAENWLSYKNIPNADGSIRLPNLKAIAKRVQRMNGNS